MPFLLQGILKITIVAIYYNEYIDVHQQGLEFTHKVKCGRETLLWVGVDSAGTVRNFNSQAVKKKKKNRGCKLIFLQSISVISVLLLSRVQLLVTLWTAVRQTSLSIINSWRLLKLMSIELVMPSNHLILHHPLLLLPSIFPSIKLFSSESALHIRWPKY